MEGGVSERETAVITVNDVGDADGNVTLSAVARRIASLHGGINSEDQQAGFFLNTWLKGTRASTTSQCVIEYQ